MANEWCAKAGVIERPRDTNAITPAISQPLVGCFFIVAFSFRPSFLLEKVEYVLGHTGILRLVPADFKILFPVLCPRPAVVVDIPGVGLGKLSRPAIRIPEIA